MSDQAWATAWYSDITSIQIPQTHTDMSKIRQAYSDKGHTIAGMLISPAIFKEQTLKNILYKEKDFFTLFLNGPVQTRTLPQAPGSRQPLDLLKLSPVSSIKGLDTIAVPLAGGDMLFYSDPQFLKTQ